MGIITDLVWFFGGWIALGILTTIGYNLIWRGRPRLIQVLAWPIIHGSMFWVQPVPTWLKPAAREQLFHSYKTAAREGRLDDYNALVAQAGALQADGTRQ